MVVIKAVLGALLGAIAGFLLFAVAGYPLFLAAAGGRDINGGIAMGMVSGFGPLGAAIGMIAGVAFVLMRHGRPSRPDADKTKGQLIFAGVAALVVGYVVLLLILQGPAKIRLDQAVLHFEVRTAATALADDGVFKPHGDLWDHYDGRTIPVPITIRMDGDQAILTGSFRVEAGMQRMQLRAHLAPALTLGVSLPLYPAIELAPGFTPWRAVDSLINPQTEDLELAFAQKVHMVRYQAVPREE